MDDFKPTAGVEYALSIYGVSDKTGLEFVVTLERLPFIAPIMKETQDFYALAEAANPGMGAKLRDMADDFRSMTREEITDYRAREE